MKERVKTIQYRKARYLKNGGRCRHIEEYDKCSVVNPHIYDKWCGDVVNVTGVV